MYVPWCQITHTLDSTVLPPLQTEMFLGGYRHSKGKETDFINMEVTDSYAQLSRRGSELMSDTNIEWKIGREAEGI